MALNLFSVGLPGPAWAQELPEEVGESGPVGVEEAPTVPPQEPGEEPRQEPEQAPAPRPAVLRDPVDDVDTPPVQLPRRPGRVDYRIEASLNGKEKRLNGKLTLSWTNRSGSPASDLWFHLYLNAFSNNQSTHLHESGGKLRGVEIDEGWGWSRVTALRVSMPGTGEWVDVTPTLRYRRPDDGREEDRTVFSVDLPEPLAASRRLEAEVQWECQLPRVRRRTGYKDDFLLVAQWFPKLGVFEGAERGWNCHQFHMNSEWFSNYGTYDVRLDLPEEYEGKVFGSGHIKEQSIQGGRLKMRFLAPSLEDRRREDALGRKPVVHDFTWTGDPDFVVSRNTFQATEWLEDNAAEVERVRAALGPDVDLGLRNVDVTVLVQPERAEQAARHRKATEAALGFYGLWFGEYPYQHITVIDPPWGGRAAGGMEYPTLFTCGTRLFTTEDMYVPESVTVHEAGHQFWYGLVGNNEFEAAWMDEGFNSYTDSEVLWRVYGPRRGTTDFARLPVDGVRLAKKPGGGPWADGLTLQRLPLPFVPDLKPLASSGFVDWWREQPFLTYSRRLSDPRWGDRVGYLSDPSTDPVDACAWCYADRSSYRTNSYPRPAVLLRSLPAVIGHDRFLRGMRYYADTWRYNHPYPDDFFTTFQEGAGVDCQWYFDELFRGTGTIDWSVEVSQRRRAKPKGFFQSEGGTFIERPNDGDDEDSPEPWRAEIMLRAGGELALPLTVQLTFDDDTVEELVWTREEQLEQRWKRLERSGDSKLIAVVLDPERGYYIDTDMSNNQWYSAVDHVAPLRWGERTLAQFQRYLHWIGGIGG